MSDPALVPFLAENGLLRAVIERSPLMLLVLDGDGNCVLASKARLAFSGRPLEEMCGKGWLDTLHPSDRPKVVAQTLEALGTARPFSIELRVRRADGAYRWMSTQGMPWVGSDGAQFCHVLTATDITDHRSADEGREEPRQLRQLIEDSHDMVYRTRFFPTHSVDYVGGAVFAITGHTAAEFYAEPRLSARCVHEDDRHLVLNALGDLSNVPLTVLLRWVHPGGRIVYAEHRRVPIYDEAGQLVAVEGIARDVTAFVEAQRRLRESEEQLRQLAARLEEAREAERAQVARELHDELGQTLTALKLDISRMQQALAQDRMTPPIVDRLQSLIGLSDIALATVKRIATRLRPPTLDHLGLPEAIQWEALTFKARTGLRCTVRTNKTRTSLSSEQQTALFRILQEALTNIARHAQASAVHVTLTERGGRFEMRISDNGRGITEQQTANPNSIGLLGMRERTALMGGAFRITGRRGKGTVVSIEVPVAHSSVHAANGRKIRAAR